MALQLLPLPAVDRTDPDSIRKNTKATVLNFKRLTASSGTGAVAGAGTLNYIPLWTPDGNTLGNSIASQSGTTISIAGSLTATGTLTISGNGTIGGTFGVTGAATLSSTLAVTGATTLSSTLAVSGNTTLGGTLGVTGATTLSSTLAVTGSATMAGTLGVTGYVTLADDLSVQGGDIALGNGISGRLLAGGELRLRSSNSSNAIFLGNEASTPDQVRVISNTIRVLDIASNAVTIAGSTSITSSLSVSGAMANTALAGSGVRLVGVTAGGTFTTSVSSSTLTVAGLTIGSFDGVLKAASGVVSGGATTTDLPEGSNLYYTDARARAAITGTTNRITVTSGVVDISGSYVGQSSIITLGTVGTGVWQGTAVAIGYGGTGAATATAAFNNLSPLTTLGDALYHNGTNNVRLAGNTTTTRKFLSQTGNGSVSAAPVWNALASSDVTDALGYTPVNRAGDTMTGLLTLSGDPSSALHAATKQYVDALSAGLKFKEAVATATTANITLSGEQTIDGVLTSSSRVLVKNQTTASQNGIYVSSSGAWSRSTDLDADAEAPGAVVFVTGGSTHANQQWVITNSAVTLGTTSIVWALFFAAESIVAGAGLTKTASTIAVGTASASRIVINADDIDLATSGVSAGTYTKITVDAYGRATVGASATTTDISEGSNLYYTDARARAAISGTTNQVNYSSSTGVISLPQDYHTGASPTLAGVTLSGLAGTGTRLTTSTSTGVQGNATTIAGAYTWSDSLTFSASPNFADDIVFTADKAVRRSVATGSVTLAGGSSASNGANLTLYGGSHASTASDWKFRAGTTERLVWDESETLLSLTGNFALSGNANINGATSTTDFRVNIAQGNIAAGRTGGTGGRIYSFGVGNPADLAAGNTEYIQMAHADSLGGIYVSKSGTGTFRDFVLHTSDAERYRISAAGSHTLTGAASITSTLGVTGATTLSSTLAVSGASTLSSTLSVSGAVTLSNLAGSGTRLVLASAAGLLSTTTASAFGLVDGTGFANRVAYWSDADSITSNSGFTYDGTTFSVGSTTITQSSGNASVAGTLAVTGASTLSSTLTVTGNTTIGGDLTVNGSDIFIGTGTSGRVLAGGELRLRSSNQTNALYLGDDATNPDQVRVIGNTSRILDVSSNAVSIAGATTVSSTLSVTGAASLSSTLGVTGAVSMGSTLTVTGGVQFDSINSGGSGRYKLLTTDFIGTVGTQSSIYGEYTFSGVTTFLGAGIGSTPTDRVVLSNTTAAAAGVQQYSPSLHFSGQGWKTNATAASQAVDFRSYLIPIQGAANPSGALVMERSIAGGAYSEIARFGSGLNLQMIGSNRLCFGGTSEADYACYLTYSSGDGGVLTLDGSSLSNFTLTGCALTVNGGITTSGGGGLSIDGASDFNAAANFDAGITFLGGTSLNTYTEGTFTATLTGVTTTVTGTARYVVVGKQVTLYLPSLYGTSNTTACTITGLPAAIWPARTTHMAVSVVRDNGMNSGGFIGVGPGTGTIDLYRYSSGTPTNVFSSGNDKGLFYEAAVSYILT